MADNKLNLYVYICINLHNIYIYTYKMDQIVFVCSQNLYNLKLQV